MSVFKSIFGSLIGAAAAIGVYFVLKLHVGETYAWFPIVTGILTGLVASTFAGKDRNTGARFVCGAFSAAIAAVAIFGIDFLPSINGQETGEFGPLLNRATTRVVAQDDDHAPDEDGADSDGDSAEAGDAAAEAASDEEGGGQTSEEKASSHGSYSRGGAPGAPGAESDPATAKRFAEMIKKKSHESWMKTWLPYVFSGIGIFCAYQLARGFGPVTPAAGGG